MFSSTVTKSVLPSLWLLALAFSPSLRANEEVELQASQLSRQIFASIGCSDQSLLINTLARNAAQSGAVNKLGIDAFAQSANSELSKWCESQVVRSDRNRASTLAYCQRVYSAQFMKFLSKVYTPNSSELNYNVFNKNDRMIAPSCRLSRSEHKRGLLGRIRGHAADEKKVDDSLEQLPTLPELPKKAPAPIITRLKDGVVGLQDAIATKAEDLLGLSKGYEGYYQSHFRNSRCPAWKDYVRNLTAPDSPLKNYASESCGRANKVTLDVIGAIPPQGGYKMVGTGVNLETHLGSARKYGLGRTRKGNVICAHGDLLCIKNNKHSLVMPSYCSGATFSAFMRTINVLDPAVFSGMTDKQLDNFTPGLVDNHGIYGLINNDGSGVKDAASLMKAKGERYSFARIIESYDRENPFSNACAGDYIQFDRKERHEIPKSKLVSGFAISRKGRYLGHSGVFLGTEINNEGHKMAYFWSSNGDTRGYGVTCEPVAHLRPKIVRVTKPRNLQHIPEYSGLPNLKGNIMFPERWKSPEDFDLPREPTSNGTQGHI